jgi:hypothetical protein
MNKLEYDNLYKFLVSLGIVLIVLPFAALFYFYNSNPILISQTEYDLLSTYTIQLINSRNKLFSTFIKVFPWVAAAFVLLGIVSLVYGIIKWFDVQKKLDKKLDAESTKKTLEELTANEEEVSEKIKKETEEIVLINESGSLTSEITENTKRPQIKALEKYYEIEDRCFNYFTVKYSKKFDFKRNIRIGNTYYDFVGVSNKDDCDLIFEIKYCRQAAGMSPRLYKTFDGIYDMGLKYQIVAHRNFKCIVVVVTPKEHLPRLENIVDTYCKAHRDNASKIEIKCMAEESL